jgi:Domain of unknown function (DUF4845)
MKKQLGVSLSGLLMVLVGLAVVALLAFKLVEPYQQFFTIQKTFKVLAADPAVRNGGMGELKIAWSKYAMIEKMDVVGPEDFDVVRDGGNVVISAKYMVRVHLFKNISLLIDFAPTSAAK